MTQRWLRSVSWIPALVMGVAILAAAVTIWGGRETQGNDDRRAAASKAAESVTVVSAAVRSQLSAAETAGSSDDQVVPAAVASSNGVSLSALTLARDSGLASLDDSGGGVVVVARYDTTSEPATVQDRRDHLTGYQVIPLRLAGVLRPLLPSPGGISVRGPDRRVVAIPASGPGSAASFTVSLGPDVASGWSLTVWTTPPRAQRSAWLVCVLLLVSGGVAAAWIVVRQRETRRRRDELAGLQGTNATVAALATLAQRTPDLGETLPAVTSELSSALGLRGLAVAVPTPEGERRIFVLGAPPDAAAPPEAHQELAAGQTGTVVLSRGGRIVATLRATAGRDLRRDEVRTLVAAGDVLASALVNAEVFSQQAEIITRMRTVDQLKTVFLATASHELRTPVAAMAGYASLLHSNWDELTPDQARGFAERVDRVAQRLSRLVEDILDFSRLQSGSQPGTSATVLDLAETVGNVLEEQPDLAPDHQVVHEPGHGLRVSGSLQAIERVVANLVGNAAKYSAPGTTIRVRTRRVDDRAELVVADEGPGIAPDQREQIFSPFYRGSGVEVVRTQGAGLGLAIVTEFATSMDGVVRVEEAHGGGASFVVSYPLVPDVITLDPGVAHVEA